MITQQVSPESNSGLLTADSMLSPPYRPVLLTFLVYGSALLFQIHNSRNSLQIPTVQLQSVQAKWSLGLTGGNSVRNRSGGSDLVNDSWCHRASPAQTPDSQAFVLTLEAQCLLHPILNHLFMSRQSTSRYHLHKPGRECAYYFEPVPSTANISEEMPLSERKCSLSTCFTSSRKKC